MIRNSIKEVSNSMKLSSDQACLNNASLFVEINDKLMVCQVSHEKIGAISFLF